MQDGLQSLVALLCRADWTRLSLSAELAETIDRAAFAALWVDSGGSRPWSFLDSRTGGYRTRDGARPIPASW